MRYLPLLLGLLSVGLYAVVTEQRARRLSHSSSKVVRARLSEPDVERHRPAEAPPLWVRQAALLLRQTEAANQTLAEVLSSKQKVVRIESGGSAYRLDVPPSHAGAAPFIDFARWEEEFKDGGKEPSGERDHSGWRDVSRGERSLTQEPGDLFNPS